MNKIIDIEGPEQSIGDLSAAVVEKIGKEKNMPAAIEPRQAGSVVTHVNAPLTPMDMLNQAVSQGANIDVLEKLMGLQDRWEANQARKAFDAAISQAKSEIGPVIRNATGHNNKRYADFAAIAKAVDPILSRYGLSYRFKTDQTDRITVTCVLSHEEGHSEETTLSGPSDTSGNKNAIQAIGSTLTYLQRYSLVAALGLAAANDDDGKASDDASGAITEAERDIIMKMIDETGSDIAKFCEVLQINSIADMPAGKFRRAVNMLDAKKKKVAANG